MRQVGYLLISDISGYTAFLTQSELEHAAEILADLFEALTANIKLPLQIAKLEGDAIFAYARQGAYIQGITLLEGVERLYAVFSDARQRISINTTCTCTACRLIPTLDLKFFVHYGEFIVDKKGELSGPDVILIHRLLKNHIVEETGISAYACFTKAAIAQMEIGEAAESMRAHIETYEHLGEVQVHVHDLHPIYERYRDQQRFLVTEDDTWIAVSAEVPAPPPVVWDYLHEPHLKARMMGAGSVTAADRLMRRGVGTMHHCAHGSMVIVHEYIDWRPFDYATHVGSFPMRLKAWVTTRLIPIDGGTRVEWRTSHMRGSRVLARLGMLAAGVFFRAEWKKTADNLRRAIDEDIASGALKLDARGAADETLAAVPPVTGAQVVR